MFPLILIYLLSLGLVLRSADSDPHFVGVRCVDKASGNYTQPSPYQTNLNTLLHNLKGGNSTSNLYSSNVVDGDSNDTTVYGFWYCRGDTQPQECRACVTSAATTIVASCPAQKEAIIWYEECVLRYANRVISSIEETDPWIWRRSASSVSEALNMDDNQFGQILVNGLQGLVMQSAYSYTSNSAVKFYGSQTTKLTPTHNLTCLVQCSPGTDTSQQCETCLRRLLGSDMLSCCRWASVWAMLFNPSCLLMYTVTSTTPTVRQTQSSTLSSNSDSGKNWVTIVIVVAATFCAVGLFLAIWWWVHGSGNNRGIIDAPMPKKDEPAIPRPPIPRPPVPPPEPFYPVNGEMGLEHRPAIYAQNVYIHNYFGPY